MRRYRVERIDDKMIVTPDRKGKYRAATAEEIQKALSDPNFSTTTAEVLIGKSWGPLARIDKRLVKNRRSNRGYSTPTPIKPMPLCLRILRRLHLYKDPLDKLIYRGS
jgi:hypothetical protein